MPGTPGRIVPLSNDYIQHLKSFTTSILYHFINPLLRLNSLAARKRFNNTSFIKSNHFNPTNTFIFTSFQRSTYQPTNFTIADKFQSIIAITGSKSLNTTYIFHHLGTPQGKTNRYPSSWVPRFFSFNYFLFLFNLTSIQIIHSTLNSNLNLNQSIKITLPEAFHESLSSPQGIRHSHHHF